VKKNAALLDRLLDLCVALFVAVDRVGEAICPSGWYTSLLGAAYSDGVAALFAGLAYDGASIDLAEACEQVWRTCIADERDTDQARLVLEDVYGHPWITALMCLVSWPNVVGVGAWDQCGAVRMVHRPARPKTGSCC
jgi:hypothetical protein